MDRINFTKVLSESMTEYGETPLYGSGKIRYSYGGFPVFNVDKVNYKNIDS